MKNLIKLVALGALAVSLTPMAFAGPKKAAAPKCPVCHMALTTKKDKMHTKMVKIKGHKYYCCSACDMKPKAKAKTKSK